MDAFVKACRFQVRSDMVSGAKSSLRWFCLHPTTYPLCSAKQLIVESEDAEYVGGVGVGGGGA